VKKGPKAGPVTRSGWQASYQGGLMYVYVASSWRNSYQAGVVKRLRESGFEVYDFKNPSPGNHGFHWREVDPHWQQWTPQQFTQALEHPIAKHGFKADWDALVKADATVLVLPCGRSAHLELGLACGYGQLTAIYMPEATEPELMYRMVDKLCLTLDEVVAFLKTEARH
jgi:hypothetical protein